MRQIMSVTFRLVCAVDVLDNGMSCIGVSCFAIKRDRYPRVEWF